MSLETQGSEQGWAGSNPVQNPAHRGGLQSGPLRGRSGAWRGKSIRRQSRRIQTVVPELGAEQLILCAGRRGFDDALIKIGPGGLIQVRIRREQDARFSACFGRDEDQT